MKKYEKYKDTNIEWIGEIPEHWEVKKVKHVFKFDTGFTPSTKKREYYQNGKYDWVTIGDLKGKTILDTNNKITEYAIKDLNKVPVPRGSLMYSFKLSVGKVAFAGKDLYTNEAIFSIFPKESLNLNYYYYSLPNQIIKNANENIYGAKILNQDLIKNAFIIVPPSSEQTQISSYLDNKTSLIDKLINNNKKLIKLLEEKRTALINKVITKGLDPNVKMKDSGIEWIGEIPEHWEVKRLKFIGQIVGGSTPTSSNTLFWNGEINWITTADMGATKGKFIGKSKRRITKEGLESIGNKIFPSGSIIISNRAPIGYVFISQVPSATNQGCKTIYNIGETVDFIYYYLLNIRKVLESFGKGTTFKELSSTSLGAIQAAFPSKLEQNEIVAYLDKKISTINKTIKRIKDENNLLREYRQSLISNVVTGKMKVDNL